MRDFNHTRIVSYDRNDWAVGAFIDRCLHILKEGHRIQIATINDAIEAHQLKLTFETVPELFKEAEVADVASAVAALFANACKYTRKTLESSGFSIYTRKSRYNTLFSSGTWYTPVAQRGYSLVRESLNFFRGTSNV